MLIGIEPDLADIRFFFASEISVPLFYDYVIVKNLRHDLIRCEVSEGLRQPTVVLFPQILVMTPVRASMRRMRSLT